MSISKIKVKNINANYPIFIGNNILNRLPGKIKTICPGAKKIALVVDKNIPKKFKNKIKKSLKRYDIFVFEYFVSEKFKSFKEVNGLVEKCLSKKFNRNDILICLGGGILGDFSGFAASIIKRGINFINLPSTLLAQVDSSIGGKTAVNSMLGKNLIGAFYQPKLVMADVSLLKSLPHREIVCGYAEILKHSIILKNNFFNWLTNYSKQILIKKNLKLIQIAIVKSCKIKLFYVNKDTNEKNIRMTLNFGHTFAHGIEAANNYSRKINHGEAVLIGMILATRLSFEKKICSYSTLNKIENFYKTNGLLKNLKVFFSKKYLNKMISFMLIDKKNYDNKINLILLKKIGETTRPGDFRMSEKTIKNMLKKII